LLKQDCIKSKEIIRRIADFIVTSWWFMLAIRSRITSCLPLQEQEIVKQVCIYAQTRRHEGAFRGNALKFFCAPKFCCAQKHFY